MTHPLNLAKPAVHLNGTSREELLRQLRAAHNGVEIAITTVAAAAPHARDYYVQKGDAFQRAQDQHEARLKALRQIANELLMIGEAVASS